MEQLLQNKFFKCFFNISFLISIISVSFMFSIGYKNIYIDEKNEIASMIISFIFGCYLIKKNFVLKTIKNTKKIDWILALLFTILTMNELRQYFDLNNASKEILNLLTNLHIIKISKISIKILSCIFLYFLILYMLKIIKKFIKHFIKDMTKEELHLAKVSLLVFSIIIIIIYSLNDNIYMMYDNVFSMDNHYVARNMYNNITWQLDIRHILFSPITMLFKISTLPITLVFKNFEPFYYIVLAIFNAGLLVIISIMLKKLTNNKWVMYIYLTSFPTLQYSFCIEKYQICAFFIVLFFYSKYYLKDTELEDLSLISSVGTMSTSVFLGFLCGHSRYNKEITDKYSKNNNSKVDHTLTNSMKTFKIQNKNIKIFFHWLKLALFFVGICGIFGKANKLNLFHNTSISYIRRFFGLSEFLKSMLFIPNYYITESTVLWTNPAINLNYVGIAILIISIIGFILNRKNKFIVSCGIWLFFALIFFVIINWDCPEAPLFNLYFSWAVIPLIVMAIDKLKINKKDYIYISIILLTLLINIPEFINIYNFIQGLTI